MWKRVTIITETIKGIENVELQLFEIGSEANTVKIEFENGRITSKTALPEQIEYCKKIIEKLK